MVDRGEQVERLIARYGLCTVSALTASVFRDVGEKAAERVLTRLLSAGRIRSSPLVGRKCFYTLTPISARTLGLDDKRCQLGMGAQAILQNYAMMAYCLLGEYGHERLMREECEAKFHGLLDANKFGAPHRTRYYFDARERDTGIIRLALMVPDLGSHPRRLVSKVRREVERRRLADGWLAKLIQQRLFSATVLTAFPGKARQIAAGLDRESFHFSVELVPGYGDLLGLIGKGKRDERQNEDADCD